MARKGKRNKRRKRGGRSTGPPPCQSRKDYPDDFPGYLIEQLQRERGVFDWWPIFNSYMKARTGRPQDFIHSSARRRGVMVRTAVASKFALIGDWLETSAVVILFLAGGIYLILVFLWLIGVNVWPVAQIIFIVLAAGLVSGAIRARDRRSCTQLRLQWAALKARNDEAIADDIACGREFAFWLRPFESEDEEHTLQPGGAVRGLETLPLDVYSIFNRNASAPGNTKAIYATNKAWLDHVFFYAAHAKLLIVGLNGQASKGIAVELDFVARVHKKKCVAIGLPGPHGKCFERDVYGPFPTIARWWLATPNDPWPEGLLHYVRNEASS